jgi:hypothetical protein
MNIFMGKQMGNQQPMPPRRQGGPMQPQGMPMQGGSLMGGRPMMPQGQPAPQQPALPRMSGDEFLEYARSVVRGRGQPLPQQTAQPQMDPRSAIANALMGRR